MDNQELKIIEKHKKELICPKCQENLVNKDYKINILNLILVISYFIAGLGIGKYFL